MLGSACLDWRSSHCAWIRVLLAVLGSEFQMEISDRRLNFRWKFQLGSEFQIGALLPTWIEILERSLEYRGVLERSEKVGIKRSFKEDSRIESREWRERV